MGEHEQKEQKPGRQLDLSILPPESRFAFETYRRCIDEGILNPESIKAQAKLNHFDLLLLRLYVRQLESQVATAQAKEQVWVAEVTAAHRRCDEMAQLCVDMQRRIDELSGGTDGTPY